LSCTHLDITSFPTRRSSDLIGREPTPFTGVIRKTPQAVIKTLKELQCETIGVYLFDENGAIGAIKSGTEAAPVWEPIPIRAFFRSEEHTSELQSRENLVCRL